MNMTRFLVGLSILIVLCTVQSASAADAAPSIQVTIPPSTAPVAVADIRPLPPPATLSLDGAKPMGPSASPSVTEEATRTAAATTAKATAEEERKEIWRQTLEQLIPNSPGEVREFKERSNEEAKASAPRVAPQEAQSQAIAVSLLPGGRSPKLTLLHGFVMAIEVLDATGQPWPIVAARTGDKEAFDVKIAGDEEGTAVATPGDRTNTATAPKGVVLPGGSGRGNVVTINALKMFQPSNLILILQGESRPISMILVPTEATEKSDLQDRITLLVDGSGPLAKPQAVASFDRLDVGDDLRRAIVGNVPKEGTPEILAPLPPGMRAWTDNKTLWLRTPAQVISPAPQAAVSMGNMRAYRLPYLSTVVVLENGHLTPVVIPAFGALAAAETARGGL